MTFCLNCSRGRARPLSRNADARLAVGPASCTVHSVPRPSPSLPPRPSRGHQPPRSSAPPPSERETPQGSLNTSYKYHRARHARHRPAGFRLAAVASHLHSGLAQPLGDLGGSAPASPGPDGPWAESLDPGTRVLSGIGRGGPCRSFRHRRS